MCTSHLAKKEPTHMAVPCSRTFVYLATITKFLRASFCSVYARKLGMQLWHEKVGGYLMQLAENRRGRRP